MGQIQLSAQLIAAPSQSNDQSFPSGTTTIPFVPTPNPKPYVVDTGRNNGNVASPSAYVILAGLGAGGPVTQAHTIYIRTNVPMQLRMTFLINNVATVRDSIQVQGIFLLELPVGSPCTLVEIEGSGAVEWYFAGNI